MVIKKEVIEVQLVMHKLDSMVQSRYVFPEVNLTDLSKIDFPVGIKTIPLWIL